MESYIDRLRDNPDFLEYEKFVISKIKELDTVKGLNKLSDKDAGEECKVRERTSEKLLEILSPFIETSEKKVASEEQIKEAKKKFKL
ncbi:MAG: hypothetical protein PHO75_02460 [Candidatus Shapirobacteria bacterium]|nr:hypothetical protein [Candidatus Shapirobacteria bacterium]